MSEALRSFFVSLLAGLQTVLSPCLFPVLPPYLMYAAGRSGSPLKTTAVFVSALSASLAAYAAAVASVGRTLALIFAISTEDVSFSLATVFLILAVVEVTPARDLFHIFAARGPRVQRLNLASAAMLGALFALSAAPCASGPLLAWTALLLLQPGLFTLSVTAFLVGVALPFIAMGALAQGVGPKLHKALSRSSLVKRSHGITAMLFASFAAMTLSALDRPIVEIEKRIGAVSSPVQALLSLALLLAGARAISSIPRASRVTVVALALPPLLAGSFGAAATLSRLVSPQSAYSATRLLQLAHVSSCALAATVWAFVSVRSGGRASRWLTVSASAAAVCSLSADLHPMLRAESALAYYLGCIAFSGAALSLISLLLRVKTS